jgi:uncharacterized protein (DUF433 family)
MQLVDLNPEVLWGAPVFPGTRVPVDTLVEYLTHGDSIESFLNDFPSVSREAAVAFLEEGATMVVNQARTSNTSANLAI